MAPLERFSLPLRVVQSLDALYGVMHALPGPPDGFSRCGQRPALDHHQCGHLALFGGEVGRDGHKRIEARLCHERPLTACRHRASTSPPRSDHDFGQVKSGARTPLDASDESRKPQACIGVVGILPNAQALEDGVLGLGVRASILELLA